MNLMNYPIVILVFAVFLFWLAARLGVLLHRRKPRTTDDDREDFNIVLGATLTLLGLIIGFSFSMAIGRYDQRKNYEEAEANAIGTEYVRADLLPESDAAQVRLLLRSYLDQRIAFYTAPRSQSLDGINAATAKLQSDLWSSVKRNAVAQPTAVSSLVAAGMNDVLNSQGYTQAAWWNRIPLSAWGLLYIIAIFGNMALGYQIYKPERHGIFFFVLPLLLGICFFLIADIDSPRGGLIRVKPQNLISLSQSLHP
jgi:hypothetical protein